MLLLCTRAPAAPYVPNMLLSTHSADPRKKPCFFVDVFGAVKGLRGLDETFFGVRFLADIFYPHTS